MKSIAGYIKKYVYESDPLVFGVVSLFTGLLIWVNYRYGLDSQIADQNEFGSRLLGRWLVFFMAFAFPYALSATRKPGSIPAAPGFFFLLIIAPAIFSAKAALAINLHFSDNWVWDNYWNHIVYWPSLALMVACVLWVIWMAMDRAQPFYGATTRTIDWKPYWVMLLIMVPLVAAASTQADFLRMYPKLKLIAASQGLGDFSFGHKLLFELAYGCDFVTIELFFRGFLVLAFIKYAGKHAILPMACFYCTIHFGKPLGECISSYFGGIILGIVVFHTRSIFGGLMVHLGIAWLMELGGYLGNHWMRGG